MPTLSKIKKQQLLLFLWIAIVCYLSLSPADDIPDVEFEIPHLDKFVHWGMYFGVSFLLAPLWQTKRYYYIKVVLVGTLMGIAMEGLQYILPYERSFDVWDMVANSLGAIAGFIAYKLLNNTPLYRYFFS